MTISLDHFVRKIKQKSYEEAIEDSNLFLNGRGLVSLIIADPPYNLNKDSKWDIGFDFSKMLAIFKKVLAPNGSAIVFNTAQNVDYMRIMLQSRRRFDEKYKGIESVLPRHYLGKTFEGLHVIDDDIRYIKTNPPPVTHRQFGYTHQYENMIWFAKTKRPYFKLLANQYFDNGMYFAPGAVGFVKSDKVIEQLILHHSQMWDTIWEPFGGTAPVFTAASKLRRNVITYEWYDQPYAYLKAKWGIDHENYDRASYKKPFKMPKPYWIGQAEEDVPAWVSYFAENGEQGVLDALVNDEITEDDYGAFDDWDSRTWINNRYTNR